jgi:hypothetical protein
MEEVVAEEDDVDGTDDTPIILSFFCSISSRSSFVEDDGQSTSVVFCTVVDVEIIVRDDDDDDDDDDCDDDKLAMVTVTVTMRSTTSSRQRKQPNFKSSMPYVLYQLRIYFSLCSI